MSAKEATLHMLCGKIAAGKSTLTAELGRRPRTIVVSEDQWLAALYPGEMASVADYVRCSGRLRNAIEPHLVALLQAGLSVVLDFPANTVANRAWMRGVFERAGQRTNSIISTCPTTCARRACALEMRAEHIYSLLPTSSSS